MQRVDLNCDLGESFGDYRIGCDEDVMPLITSANVACGWHGGDPLVMQKAVTLCAQAGVHVGAHPGLPDLMGFGRRSMAVSHAEAKAYVQYQVAALAGMCAAQGVALRHVKLHGALYNMAGGDYALARAICDGVAALDQRLILLALSGSHMVRAAKDAGLAVAQEVFADRAYEADGSLVARGKPGAMITDEDEAVSRVVGMVCEGRVRAVTGEIITIAADSICIHGDGDKALAFARRIRGALAQRGVDLCPLGTADV
ncbi:MAG: 5-oxoprolinase subunit PxpA [Oscillospiraceae bacterium]|jgi:UPF0271 protein|nr:5-oxoprolinase subunit PxpA [Oscillospiraceae bacterium]